MDPTTLIVTALTVGATFVAKQVGGEAVKDAYRGLKEAVKSKFTGKPQAEIALAESEKDPETWEKPLQKVVAEANLSNENDIVEAAKRLLELADSEGAAKGKYNIVFRGKAQGTVIGDGTRVSQTFGTESPDE